MKSSLVITVINEENSSGQLIDSISKQTKIPDEIVIIDGGSTDRTIERIKGKIIEYKKKLNVKLFEKKGNRSTGRNFGISRSSGSIILSTDSGCTLDKNWIRNITQPFLDPKVDVVAGYYKGLYKNIFQKSLTPYVLVMPDKVDPKNFLPTTRSMAFKKFVWRKAGGFNENLSHNEDYDFAFKLKKLGAKIKFQKNAIVNWIPRKNLKESFVMFFRFALGDIEAEIIRPKVFLIFLRYLIGLYLIPLNIIEKSTPLLIFSIILFISYILWTIIKNYKYVKHILGFSYLPLLQFTSDIAAISGTTAGFVKRGSQINILSLVKRNKVLILLLVIFIILELLMMPVGIPNKNHPFTYFMDEWHQSQAVRNLFRHGTPNMPGGANGSIFQFFLTGIYLIPFYLLGIINPFNIKSSVTDMELQENLFIILRSNTILFGVFCILVLAYMSKKYFKLNPFLVSFLFIFNPLWLILNNYFKYDIALLFWVLLSFLFFLRYTVNPNTSNFLLAGFFSGLSLSTKLSAIPLILLYIVTFLIFTPNYKKYISQLFLGLFIFLATFLLFGVPDLILGKGNILEYLQSNLFRTPETTSDIYNIGMNYAQVLLYKIYPVTFGRVLYFGFLLSLITGTLFYFKSIFKNRINILTLLFFIFFALSFIPLKIGAASNRTLVLLPFIVLIQLVVYVRIYKFIKSHLLKYPILIVFILLMGFQMFESLSWVTVRLNPDPRVESSKWLIANIPKKVTIGIENIPIYQFLPDIVLREFYLAQYNNIQATNFSYQIINSQTDNFPEVVVLTNSEIEAKYLKKSEKRDIIEKMGRNYVEAAEFKPDFKYFNLINSEFDYYISVLIFIPNISFFEKIEK